MLLLKIYAMRTKKAYERCADNVGRNFKAKALEGGYLVSVDVIHGVDKG